MASELPHVWVGKPDADQGLVNQQVFACKTCLEQVKKAGAIFLSIRQPRVGEWNGLLTNSPSLLPYEYLVIHDQLRRLQMNSCNYTDAEFAAPGIFTITRKKDWLSQSLEYSERHRHEWKHIKIDHEPAGKEILNDAWEKKKTTKKQAYYIPVTFTEKVD